MSLIDAIRYRLRVLFRGDAYGRDLEDEIAHYIELESLDQQRDVDDTHARARARATLGNVTYVNEERRMISGLATFDALRQDTRFVLRVLRRRRVFATVTVATLALGIGAATSIFSIADVVLFRPLTVANAASIITVWQTRPELRTNPVRAAQWDRGGMSLPNFRAWRAAQRSFESVAVWTNSSAVLSDATSSDDVPLVRASASLPMFRWFRAWEYIVV